MTQPQKSSFVNFRPFIRKILWHEIGMICLILMELTWILPWFRSITPIVQATTGTSSFFVLLVFLLVVNYANKLLCVYDLRPSTHQLIMIAILLLGVYSLSNILVYPGLSLGFGAILSRTFISLLNTFSAIPEGFIVILMIIFIWWRGIVISTSSLEIRTTERKFRFGILALAVFAIVCHGTQIKFLLSVLPIYFAAGLLAVAFSRTSSLGRGITAYRLPYTGSWFIGLVLLTVLTIGVGYFVGQLLQSELAYLIYDFFSKSFGRLLTYLVIIFLPIVGVLMFVVEELLEYLSQFMDSESVEGLLDQLQEQPIAELPLEQGETAFRLPPEVIVVIVILLLAGLVVLLVRRVNRQKRYSIPDIMDEGETVFQPETVRSRVKRFLSQIQERIDTIRRFGIGRRMIAAAVIRRIYGRLLDLAADLGKPRDLDETPYEFQEKLVQIFPNQEEQVELITNSYVQIRYGEIPEEEHIITLVEEAWSSIEKEARNLVRIRRA